MRRKFSRNKFFSRYSDVSAMQRQHNDFFRFHSRAHDFKRFDYCSIRQYCDNNFDNFVDDSLADFEESVNCFNYSVDHAPHVSLNQPFEVLHKENSRGNNHGHFDKQHRKRSYRRGSHQSDRLHPTHHPIDLSSRTDTPVDEINLLSKGPSFCPIP